jgi:hypothetical protein
MALHFLAWLIYPGSAHPANLFFCDLSWDCGSTEHFLAEIAAPIKLLAHRTPAQLNNIFSKYFFCGVTISAKN